MKYSAGFIGVGNMGGALAKAASKAVGGEKIAVADFIKEKASDISGETGAILSDNSDIVQNAKYIFLGVKPQMLKSLFDEIAPILKTRQDEFILVSMAAGTPIKKIKELSRGDYPVIRIMPNTPAAIGKGVILFTSDNDELDTAEFEEIMSTAGTLDKIPEGLIDAASCVSGCGPAFVYMFIEALADGGVKCGLPRNKALSYACDTLIGAAELVKSSGKHPGLLKDEVTSPGGTTIEGVHALEKNAFRSGVIDAVDKAYEKTLKLKK